MRIISWNMNRLRRTAAAHAEAWTYLRDSLRADVALVQEAVPPPGPRSVYRPIHESNARYMWGSAVVGLSPGVSLRDRPRVPLASWDWGERPADALPESHPGASAVADVLDEAGNFLLTVVSLYGQWEMMGGDRSYHACARVHRMLSDLTSVFERARKRPVVIAGDLNITTQGPHGTAAAGASAAFARMRAWGLADCIAHTRSTRPRLAGCICVDGDACAHVQTYRHGIKAESSPTQLDYAYASQTLLPRLMECRVLQDDAAWAFSDHCPIVLDFV